MNLIKHSRYIYQYDNFVPKSECEMIQHFVETSDSYLNSIDNMNAFKNKIRHNSAIIVTDWVQEDDKMSKADNIIHRYFSRCHQKYLSENKAYYFLLRDRHVENLSCKYTYRRYDENDYYDWHVDMSSNEHLVFSYILYLNDDFEGGDTLFLDDRIRVRPKAGSMLCFPCTPQMTHKGSPVMRGTKKVVWTCMSKIY
jgi:hypothetical protein